MTIDTFPILRFTQIQKSGNLDGLTIDEWESLNVEVVNFLLQKDKDYRQSFIREKERAINFYQAKIEGNTIAMIKLKAEILEESKLQNNVDLFELVIQLEKYLNFAIDVEKVSVKKFYTYLIDMKTNIKKNGSKKNRTQRSDSR